LSDLGILTYGLQWNNRVGDQGALALGEMLKTNSSIQILNLVKSLFVFVLFGSVLKFLHCGLNCGLQGYNQLGNAGAIGLAEGLKSNCSLRELNLVS
jgi:hypothetical protein